MTVPRREWTDGPEVGAIGLGCMGMSFAYTTDRDGDDPSTVIRRGLDLGVTFLDTSDVYGPFTNEELIGKAIAGRRDEVVLATKGGCGLPAKGASIARPDGRPEYLRKAIDASLQRLDVDYVDLYYLHTVDPNVPIEDSVGALADMVRAGKTRSIGLSKVDVATLDRAEAVHPISAVQSELSLWSREPLADVVAWCEQRNVAFVPFSPLGRGFLTGRYRSATFASDDIRARLPRFQADALAANLAIVDGIGNVASRYGATNAQVALAWVLAQSQRIVPIPGTRRVSRLEENAAAAALHLSTEDLAELDTIPAPVGGRSRT